MFCSAVDECPGGSDKNKPWTEGWVLTSYLPVELAGWLRALAGTPIASHRPQGWSDRPTLQQSISRYIVCDHGYARTRYRLLLLLLLCVRARAADELLYAGSHVEGHDKRNKTEWDVAGEEQETLLGGDGDSAERGWGYGRGEDDGKAWDSRCRSRCSIYE